MSWQPCIRIGAVTLKCPLKVVVPPLALVIEPRLQCLRAAHFTWLKLFALTLSAKNLNAVVKFVATLVIFCQLSKFTQKTTNFLALFA